MMKFDKLCCNSLSTDIGIFVGDEKEREIQGSGKGEREEENM